MDPYLEHPQIFPDFHDSFVLYCRELLQPQLPEPYYAGIGRRAWIEISERYIGPDVDVTRRESRRREGKEAAAAAAVATEAVTEPVVVHVPHDELVEPFVEVYYGRGSERRLVTTIELLTTTEKTPGSKGRKLYLRKQREVLSSKVHLVEIDLLRGGEHTTAVPLARLRRAVPHYDYHVCVHQFDNLEDYFVYPIRLRDPLPTIAVPLLPGDGAVALDLQAVFRRTYDAGPYRREIDYREPPPGPELAEADLAWVKGRVEQFLTSGGEGKPPK